MASASAMVTTPTAGRKAPPPPPNNSNSTTTNKNNNSQQRKPPPPPPPPHHRKPPPPPPKGAPPPPSKHHGKPPPPPVKKNAPPPPPPPPPSSAKRPAPPPAAAAAASSSPPLSTAKRVRTAAAGGSSTSAAQVSIMAPVVMRDVEVAFTRKHQVGQGTYGSVYVAQDNGASRDIVALKRINTKQEENGFPITAIREVKILKALNHPNVVRLQEIATSKAKTGNFPDEVFMVLEYLEYDLTGILETPEIRFTADHVKSWSQQLLTGTHYMHINKVIHRDLKASNLLINKKGELKIADWGLARSWNADMKRLTNTVITLWYRPPELLLGAAEYTDKIDMWSVGCIIAEMFRRNGFLKGKDEAAQLELIFKAMGHPTEQEWPDIGKKCRLWKKFAPASDAERLPNRLREALTYNLSNPRWMTDAALYMLSKLLSMNPDNRWSAQEALDADYFFETPVVKPASELSMNFAVQSVHEWDCRRKFEANLARNKQKQQG